MSKRRYWCSLLEDAINEETPAAEADQAAAVCTQRNPKHRVLHQAAGAGRDRERAAFRVALCHRGQRILGLLPTSASLAICREHHHVDGRQQAEDVQLGSHSPTTRVSGLFLREDVHHRAVRHAARDRDLHGLWRGRHRTFRLPSKREPQGLLPRGISKTQSSEKNAMMRSRSCALKASHSSVSVDRMSIAAPPLRAARETGRAARGRPFLLRRTG